MAEGDIIMMRQEELKRLHLIRQVIEKVLAQVEAGNLLSLSVRQIRRIAKRVLKEGDKGVLHKSRGRPSPNAIEEDTKNKAIRLCKTRYEGFNPTLAAEKLFEINGIKLSRETLRGWFKQNDIPYQTRRKRPHRNWRERRHHFGAMEQVDGSHHDWFENRGPKCVLMGYIDDANNNVFARFHHSEGTFPFMDSFKRYVRKYGLPQSVYMDRHPAYKVNNGEPSIEDQLNNREPESQVQRALGELGVEVTFAYSPQAKGRIERLFRTFQDRLVKEMRLKGIKSVEEGNKFLKRYLPIYNKRFALEPLEKGDLHRPLPKKINLDKILCRKTEHGLNNDSTVVHDKKLYHILDKAYAKKIMVEERINGRLLITYKGRELKYRQITQRPVKTVPAKGAYLANKAHKPPIDHPWKRSMYERYQHINNYSQREKGSQKEKELLLVKS